MSHNERLNAESSEDFAGLDADETEILVERKVKEQLRSLQEDRPSDSSGGWELSRRTLLSMMGAGAVGAGMLGASTGTAQAAKPKESGNPDIIYADTAADIQPAINELAEDIDSGGARGGVVQLGAKTYYPRKTIFLKGGVTLQGVRRSRQTGDTRSTVLSTEKMNEGAEAYTIEHDRDSPHPHFPVVTGYIAPAVEDGEMRTRDPTDYEDQHWGHDIGLRNVIIRADKQRWWDWDQHGAGSVYDTEKEATYFGVYDAMMFEQCRNVLTQNVETRDFLGYGGFWKACPNAIDRGGMYRGGATDYHGSAYELDRASDTGNPEPRYTTGMWDFEAEGPLPTVTFAGHTDNHFISGGWSPHNRIIGKPQKFIGDEADYRNGNAPLTDPNKGRAVVRQLDQRTKRLNGYSIKIEDNAQAKWGLLIDDNICTVRNTQVWGGGGEMDIGIKTQGGDIRLENVKVGGCLSGVMSSASQPSVEGLTMKHVEKGFIFSGRANPNGPMNGVRFRNVQKAFGNQNGRPVVFNHPSFLGCDEFGENFEDLVINTPSFNDGVSNFPAEYEC